MTRPTKDQYFVNMAHLAATRSTCLRRSVGCVLVNSRGHILSTGYNGVAAGRPHCNEGHPCKGADSPSGTNLDGCQALHAEQNALLQCPDVHDIAVCYTTTQPCMTCTKLLLGTSCHTIIYSESYTHQDAVNLWLEAGRNIMQTWSTL